LVILVTNSLIARIIEVLVSVSKLTNDPIAAFISLISDPNEVIDVVCEVLNSPNSESKTYRSVVSYT
jgi:hypothetical protein